MEVPSLNSKKDLLTRKNFPYLLINQLISRIAEYLFFIGVVFYIYNQSSTADTSGVFIAKTLALLLLSPVVGVIVDRHGRKKVMVTSTLLKAVFVLSLAAVFNSSISIYLLLYLYFVTFLLDACSLFFGTARSAIIPSIVKTDQLKTANSLLTLADDLIDTLGPTLASLMILAIGRERTPLLAAIIFGISVILLKKLDVVEEPSSDMEDSFLEEVKLGLAFVKTSRPVLTLLLISGGL
ncbi:MFS transporter [Thermococcus kodakarensis]|nr:MFS transporter [Thermococcus kodakarensis]WCN28294.1 MFS transporter [Thermococcus kodakarensis]WCN30589.1 MFS transporter [Thermococcus kodakarensis]